MFLIGIFGICSKVKSVGDLPAVCPACGRRAALHVVKDYDYFHLFFIPLLRWNSRYFVTCPHCASVMEAQSCSLHVVKNNCCKVIQLTDERDK